MELLIALFGNTPIEKAGREDFEITSKSLAFMVVFPSPFVWENGYQLFNEN